MIYNLFNIKEKINAIKTRVDIWLVLVMYLLVTISTIFVYSASRNTKFVFNNLLWISIGTGIYIVILFINYNIIEKYIYYVYGITCIVLLYVRFFGANKLGAQRWFSLFGIQIQPTEFAKIVVCIILSYVLIKLTKGSAKNLFDIIKVFITVLPILILILLQPDLGSTLIIIFAYGCMLYLSNSNVKPLIYIFIVMCIMSYPIYRYVLKDYQKTRIEIFLNPEKDVRGKGWHITQSKISIGSGKITGKGIFEGSQSRLKFLPEPQTDFIFSVIAEEIGFLGSLIILSIYFWLIYILINISIKIENTFGRYIIYGITGIFLAHVIINIGMTIGLVPVTGKPLLLLSYGGSSFISSFCMLALVQNIKIYDNK